MMKRIDYGMGCWGEGQREKGRKTDGSKIQNKDQD
jgi:hypothetical protein